MYGTFKFLVALVRWSSETMCCVSRITVIIIIIIIIIIVVCFKYCTQYKHKGKKIKCGPTDYFVIFDV